jgi:hypothetical protein
VVEGEMALPVNRLAPQQLCHPPKPECRLAEQGPSSRAQNSESDEWVVVVVTHGNDRH